MDFTLVIRIPGVDRPPRDNIRTFGRCSIFRGCACDMFKDNDLLSGNHKNHFLDGDNCIEYYARIFLGLTFSYSNIVSGELLIIFAAKRKHIFCDNSSRVVNCL